ncbi:helix-turn-helix domain-containing protein [Mycobacterium seoulense]|uniref:Uncharacterized protein n=1 Tax=Mycobacterium seoulense TaxID=386911 RepID=A0A7I7NWJ9_9MYCO|nr:helix-turn-helix domain-containing protein [Mycobacterium seoulense]MCV7436067.1 helix-turn-helix domain-containing protein [Mycobacterium seoulense]BBY01036.1 hypothetical protein MSEO_15350 [Mycobacterium seoulense]
MAVPCADVLIVGWGFVGSGVIGKVMSRNLYNSAFNYNSGIKGDDYYAHEFSALDLELDRAERREIVVSLRESGMSLRAIAAATGVSHQTAIRDLAGGPQSPENGPPDGVIDVDAEDDSGDWYCEGGGHDANAATPSEQVGRNSGNLPDFLGR